METRATRVYIACGLVGPQWDDLFITRLDAVPAYPFVDRLKSCLINLQLLRDPNFARPPLIDTHERILALVGQCEARHIEFELCAGETHLKRFWLPSVG